MEKKNDKLATVYKNEANATEKDNHEAYITTTIIRTCL